MIHNINGADIDLSKLERVSEIDYNRTSYMCFMFRYSLNGFIFDEIDDSKERLIKTRQDLMHSWYLYKLGENK